MTSITYGISTEKYESNKECRISYGIVVYSEIDKDGTATIIASIRDISSDKKAVEELVQKCNLLKLSLLHLSDVVEDFLAE
jgi:hypothetical protein